jgi:hypothetical protein
MLKRSGNDLISKRHHPPPLPFRRKKEPNSTLRLYILRWNHVLNSCTNLRVDIWYICVQTYVPLKRYSQEMVSKHNMRNY